MPTSPRSLKDVISKKITTSPLLKRIIVATSLVVSNVASYVVGSEGISYEEILKTIVQAIAQGVL